MLHVRTEGRSLDLDPRLLDLSDLQRDPDLRLALARHLDLPADHFDLHVIDRRPNGTVVVRPEAVYG